MDVRGCNPTKSCLWDFKYSRSRGSQRDVLLEMKENTPMLLLTFSDSVIIEPAARKMKTPPAAGKPLLSAREFLATKLKKSFIFPRKVGEGKRGGVFFFFLFDSTARLVLSLRPPDECTDYHRPSGRKQSCRIGPRPVEVTGLWMQIKLCLFRKHLMEKTNPKSCSVARQNCQT